MLQNAEHGLFRGCIAVWPKVPSSSGADGSLDLGSTGDPATEMREEIQSTEPGEDLIGTLDRRSGRSRSMGCCWLRADYGARACLCVSAKRWQCTRTTPSSILYLLLPTLMFCCHSGPLKT